MKKMRLFIFGLAMSFFFTLSSVALALDSPVPVSPATPYGTADIYYASRTPTFSWSHVSGATWYRIWVSKSATPSTAVIEQWVRGTSWTANTGPRSSLNKPPLEPGVEYSWWVQSWNETERHSPWSSEAQFVAGKIHVMSINANAFTIYESNTNDRIMYYVGGALKPLADRQNEYGAPVNLPHGSKVLWVRFYYFNDGNVSTPSECWLYRSRFQSTNREEMAFVGAGDLTSGSHFDEDTSIANSIVDDWNYSYFLNIQLESTSNWLIHVHIAYIE